MQVLASILVLLFHVRSVVLFSATWKVLFLSPPPPFLPAPPPLWSGALGLAAPASDVGTSPWPTPGVWPHGGPLGAGGAVRVGGFRDVGPPPLLSQTQRA